MIVRELASTAVDIKPFLFVASYVSVSSVVESLLSVNCRLAESYVRAQLPFASVQAVRLSSREAALPPLPPLRTVRARFRAHGSSLSNARLRTRLGCLDGRNLRSGSCKHGSWPGESRLPELAHL